jgi:glycosyltransferase involved in cell wall biosynthesis
VREKLPENIFVAAHVSKIYGPVQALLGYLKTRRASFNFISLPFSYAGMPSALLEKFESGRLVELRRGHAARGFDPWLWIRDFWFVLWQGWRASSDAPIDLFVGVDNLNASAGVLLKRLGRVNKVCFYVIDYSSARFKNPLLNFIYQAMDRFAVAGADGVWNLSERMRAVRRKQGLEERRNLLVPVGVELDGILHPARGQVKRRRLLYMGALQAGKGIELLIEAFAGIKKRVPKAELHIIGYGPFEGEARRLASQSPARQAIKMPGGMSHAELFKKIPVFGVAFAPYLDDPGSYTWWSDPTKPKEYLACGLPLIITKVPWIWERVADRKRPMGIAINYDLDQLTAAAVKLLSDERFYWRCRKNALEFASTLSWDAIYDKAFGSLCAIP